MSKKIKQHIFFITMLFFVMDASAQTHCDSLHPIVNKMLTENISSNSTYVTDGQSYLSFITEDEVSEIKTTLFAGTTYRIATSAGDEDNYILFELLDKERNSLFSNADHGNSPYWDFKVENTIECTIESKLDLNKKLDGCTLMMIAFKKGK